MKTLSIALAFCICSLGVGSAAYARTTTPSSQAGVCTVQTGPSTWETFSATDPRCSTVYVAPTPIPGVPFSSPDTHNCAAKDNFQIDDAVAMARLTYLPEGDCYYHEGDWKDAITTYTKIGSTLVGEKDELTYKYHFALAYKASGDMKSYRRLVRDAYTFSPSDTYDYDAYKAVQAANDALITPAEKKARAKRAAWELKRLVAKDLAEQAQSQAEAMKYMSPDEKDVYQNADGHLCHKSVFTHGDSYNEVTWWFCDENNHQEKAYTFLNGNLTSTYTP
jgi:hypothetical protein